MCNKSKNHVDLCSTHDKVESVSNKNQNDRLDILLAKCEQEIREGEDRLRLLKAKRDNLKLLVQESEKLVNPQSEPDKFREVGITQAINEAIKDLWRVRKHGATVNDIKGYLLAHGFKAPENFDTAVYTVLNRLCSEPARVIEDEFPKERVVSDGQNTTRIPGRKVYKPNI